MTTAHEKEKIEEMERKEKKLREITAEYLQGKMSLQEYCRLLPEVITKLDLRKLASDLERQKCRRQLQEVLDSGGKLLSWFPRRRKRSSPLPAILRRGFYW